MRILAFDCAGAQCAAAILSDGAIIAEDRIRSERGHAQLLMPLLVDLLASGGMGFGDLDRFAVTTGPGSFTGIRVALAAAHGLALGTGKPVVGVTVFEALATAAAETARATPRLLVAIESRRLECFVQLFDRDAKPLGAPAMLPPEAVSGWAGPGALAVVGDAAALHRAASGRHDRPTSRLGHAGRPGVAGARLAAPAAKPDRRPPPSICARPTPFRPRPVAERYRAAPHRAARCRTGGDAARIDGIFRKMGRQGLCRVDRHAGRGRQFRPRRDDGRAGRTRALARRRRRRRDIDDRRRSRLAAPQASGRFCSTSAEAAMRRAGVARVFLEVAVDNGRGCCTVSMAFRAEGLRADYYRTQVGHTDASVFVKNLP